jgi:hypothetical protein
VSRVEGSYAFKIKNKKQEVKNAKESKGNKKTGGGFFQFYFRNRRNGANGRNVQRI